ncbi:uncharacterized protein LOC110418321 [Herrania umbratica]|uniref:Uncharacterized protein LOC110418321 n=1 Tax=Herrania umbratica TaxID=108875 RepID=A0A6J1AJC3_9ROSI|nr:uncharacterized protein LOC110418321 [Herrania umbratica]
MQQPRDTHLDKVCDICGDVGYGELIETCSQCSIGRHFYCMRRVVTDMHEDWVCEVCLSENDIDSLKPGQAGDVLDSSRKHCLELGRQVACKRPKGVERGKVKFLPTEEVIKLSSGSPRKEFPLKSSFRSKPVPAKLTASLSKRSFMGPKNVGASFNPIKVRSNPSFSQLGSSTPPRRGGLQIISSISQHAVKTPKELKVESDLVVSNKENVCKGHISDTILPNNKQTILPTKTEETMRSSRPSPSRLHTTIVGSERESWNIRLKVSLYRPHLPAIHTTWMGGFKFPDTATPGEFYGGFLARPPSRVHRKAYEFTQKMPPVLQVNLLRQCHLQADILQNGCLDLCDIALYFYPVDYTERSEQNYNHTVSAHGDKKFSVTSYIDV